MKMKIIGLTICLLLIGFSCISATANSMVDKYTKTTFDDQSNIKKLSNCRSGLLDYWTEQEKLISTDGSPGDNFGLSISIDGNYAIVGAYDENGGAGSAYIYDRNGETWTERQKLTASDGEAGDYFGYSVSIYENLAVIGAYGDEGDTGSAYIFNRSESTWIEEHKLTASDGEAGDYFGSSVSINKNIAIVGAYGDDSYTGSVYAFNHTNTNGTENIKLEAPDSEIGDRFGYSLSYDGRFAIIGAHGDDSYSGSAYILEYCCYWKWREKVNISSGLPYFGWSVSIDGDYAIIGAPGIPDSGSTGSVYIFKRDENNWLEHTYMNGANNDEYLGKSVSIDGSYAVAGAFGDDSGTGLVKIYNRNGTTWSEEQILNASDGEAGDYFGNSVSINAGYLIIGAVGDDGNTGSAYIFLKIGIPDISIEIIGGFGVNVIITNNGDNETQDLFVNIYIEGGVFNRIDDSYDYTTDLLPGQSVQLSTGMFLGLGKIYITATTDYKVKTVYGLQLLIYTFIQ